MPVVKNEIVRPPLDGGVSKSKIFLTAEETEHPEEVEVEGKIPSYIIGGKYLRVGPGKFDFRDFTVNHWLDGYALISKFEIHNKTIVFEKKYAQTDAYKKAMALQKPAISEFGTRAQADAKKGFLSRVISTLLPEFTDNAYSTLFQMGPDLFATCDTQYFTKINPSSLDSECKCDSQKAFSLNGQCAHPLTDSKGNIFNLGFSIGATGVKYQVLKIPFGKTSEEMMKNAKIIATISPRWTGQFSTMHSFGMSENYIIFIEQPHIVSVKRIAASVVKGDTLKDWLEWRPEEKNKFYIIDKTTGKVLKTDYFSNAFYFMHFVNCYEESNQVICDIISYDSPMVLDSMTLTNLRGDQSAPADLPYIQRFVIPLIPDLKVSNIRENLNLVTKSETQCTAVRTGNKIIITGESITDLGMDLPTLNKKSFGKKVRYCYASGTIHQSSYKHCVCKVDLETREVTKWKMNEYTFPGEPYFVPDPKGSREDDGVLIVGVTDMRQGQKDYLMILDATDLTEIGRATFKNHVPTALHGIFLPN
ncbi:unnamed protein product [Orchesella dallaii]|uniref:Beta,beta-carotene 15,15'-monooxygenase n=1 Tax=Orchesella dallaii TaxID=48710 RepID=A0ABP1QR74_9HEXA